MQTTSLLYEPLKVSRQEIRLIRVLPRSDEDMINCKLEVVSLNTHLFYRALSYEWRPEYIEEQSSCVFVNSQAVPTTPNLRLALAHVQTDAWHWIDALCINQSDDVERGQQVQMMTKIFRTAYAVDVWLGLGYSDIRLGFQLINEFEAEQNQLASRKKYSEKAALTKFSSADYESHWYSLFMIRARSYWTRLWIVQEIVVNPCSESIQLFSGQHKCSFQVFGELMIIADRYAKAGYIRAYKVLKGWSSITSIGEGHFESMRIFQHARLWSKGGYDYKRLGLLPLLAKYHAQGCDNPRDKVYALLGVSMPYPNSNLIVDYTLSVAEVYRKVARYIIEGSKRLDILLYCRKLPTAKFCLPSWVPNWESYDSNRRFPNDTFYSRHVYYFSRAVRQFSMEKDPHDCVDEEDNEGCDASSLLPSTINFSPEGNVLITNAILLGSIKLPDFPTGYQDDEKMIEGVKELSKWFGFAISSLRKILSIHHPPPSESGTELPSRRIIRMFYETLAYGCYGPVNPAKMMPFREFLSYYVDLESISHGPKWPILQRRILRAMINSQLFSLQIPSSKHTDQSWNAFETSKSELGGRLEDLTIGLCPPDSRPHDVAVVIGGCRDPVLLRPKGKRYQLIGKLFVHGFMNGQAVLKFPRQCIELE